MAYNAEYVFFNNLFDEYVSMFSNLNYTIWYYEKYIVPSMFPSSEQSKFLWKNLDDSSRKMMLANIDFVVSVVKFALQEYFKRSGTSMIVTSKFMPKSRISKYISLEQVSYHLWDVVSFKISMQTVMERIIVLFRSGHHTKEDCEEDKKKRRTLSDGIRTVMECCKLEIEQVGPEKKFNNEVHLKYSIKTTF